MSSNNTPHNHAHMNDPFFLSVYLLQENIWSHTHFFSLYIYCKKNDIHASLKQHWL